MQVVFASTNAGKISEMSRLFVGSEHQVLNPSLLLSRPYPDVLETGSSYRENAYLKAAALAKLLPEQTVFADDSGLEVEVLKNWPGVLSARVAASDELRRQAVLEKVAETSNRRARFVCELCLILPQREAEYFRGEVTGTIAKSAGSQGFGYDPIFQPDGYQKTFGQLDSQTKDQLSHRGQAVCLLIKALNSYEKSTSISSANRTT